MSLITLTTDFGNADGYVAAMKGVIYGINPSATIVDVSHDVPAQDVLAASFVLGSVHRFYPQSTIHLAVVDPGVGTARRAIAVVADGVTFVAPDNGILTHALGDFGCFVPPDCVEEPQSPKGQEQLPLVIVQVPREISIVELNEPRFWLPEVSSTFHGRDLFAPVAAHLSLGTSSKKMGSRTGSVSLFALPRPVVQRDGSILGTIMHVDRFGNLISNIAKKDVAGFSFAIEFAGQVIQYRSAYAEGEGLLAIFDSAGRLEIACRDGNAAERLRAGVYHQFVVKPIGERRVGD